MTQLIDKEQFKQYIDTDLTLYEIAEKTGCSYSTVYGAFMEFGVNIKKRSSIIRQTNIKKKINSISKEELQKAVDERISMKDLSQKYQCAMNTVRNRCVSFKIDMKDYNNEYLSKEMYSKKLADKLTKEILQEYTDTPTTINKISIILGVKESAIKRYLKLHNIDRTECNKHTKENANKSRSKSIIKTIPNVKPQKHCKKCQYRGRLNGSKETGQLFCDYSGMTLRPRSKMIDDKIVIITPENCTYYLDQPPKKINHTERLFANSKPNADFYVNNNL